MTSFAQALHAARLASARALGENVKTVSWLLSNPRPDETVRQVRRAA